MGNTAFVLMKFSKSTDEIYTYLSTLLKSLHWTCDRADQNYIGGGDFVALVIRKIEEADIIIADFTEQSCSVTYELALAHALDKPTILIAGKKKDIPAYMIRAQCIIYGTGAKGFNDLSDGIRKNLEAYSNGSLAHDNPFTSTLKENPYKSIASTRTVIEAEKKTIRRVCVVTPKFVSDHSPFKEVVIENLKKDIEYIYIIPSIDYVIRDLKVFYEFLIQKIPHDKLSLFSAYTINQEYIESDITIIDPLTKNEKAYILAPTTHNLNYRLRGDHLQRIISRFNMLVTKGQKIL
ncbi:MAG: hypothetical protein HQL56_18545 [Magnetococcales bacterium]|nr:hypothetical protein [Magnetococcales bacterium]